MKEFMTTLNNMKKYQGIDITRPKTYLNNYDIIHNAFNFEKNIVATIEAKEISNNVIESSKILKLTNKKQ